MGYETFFKGMDLGEDTDLVKGGKRKSSAAEIGNQKDPKAGKKTKTGATRGPIRGGGKPNPKKTHPNIEKSLFPVNRKFSLVQYEGASDVSLAKSIESGLQIPSQRNLAMEQESARHGIAKALPVFDEDAADEEVVEPGDDADAADDE